MTDPRVFDPVDEQAVRRFLSPGCPVGGTLHCFASVDSTNSFLKRIAADGAPHGTAALADEQTAGRGRRGRSFTSGAGCGVYLSVLLRPRLSAQQLLPLTGFAAVAVCRAVERIAPVDVQIKWTNDLLLGGKKLCGILTELALGGEGGAPQYVVLGAGVNVNNPRFDGELDGLAASLRTHTGKTYPRAALAAAMLEEIGALVGAMEAHAAGDYLDDYRRRCVNIGREARLLWRDTQETVRVLAVDDELGLVVRHGDGRTETVRSGEASVRGLYGYAEE